MIYDLAPDRTALLVIDAQREYFDQDGALFTPHAAEIRDNVIDTRTALDELRRTAAV